MALIQPPMMVTGGTHPARALRMMIRDLSRGASGVTEFNDLRTQPLATPGAGVRVTDGSAVINGATWGQGSYTQYNVGDADVPIAPTGASERTDLLVLRVEDPEYEGTRDPAHDDIGYFHVIPGVSAATADPPRGMTAIPLARITIPPSTATITDAMITDLRNIANPRRDRRLYTSFFTGLSQLTSSDGKWHDWPGAAKWSVYVPVWAVEVRMITTIAGLRLSKADAYAHMQQNIGGIQGQDTSVDDDQGNHIRRNTVVLADNITIPPEMRGTRQNVHIQTKIYKTESGDLGVDGATSLILDTDFTEGVY